VVYSCKPFSDYATTFVSENAGKVLGYEAADFLESPRFWTDHIHPQDRSGVLAALSKLTAQGHQSLEYRFRHKDGSYRWLRDDARLLRDGSGEPLEIVGSRIDVNGRKWMEDALRQSEQSLAAFFTEAPIGLLWVTADGRILRANRAQASMLGHRSEELFGQHVAEFGADPEIVPAMVARLAQKESLHDNLVRLRRKDETILHVMIDANGFWENGRMVHSRWFVRDVSKRVELQKEILGIGEGVQRRIGQDLHDDLCQQLTGIEFLSQALERRLAGKSPAEAERAREISRLTRQAIGYTRELSHTMSPMELVADGLADALKNLADRTRRVFHIDCRFRGDSNPLADDGVTRIYLYRIAQEAINNAIKHGKAKRILIGLRTNGDNIILGVEDNGVGLPLKLPAKRGFGLRIMDYRAATLGGSLSVQRRKGGGTCVVCSLPKGLRQLPSSSIP
jgi:PAS domain S-box-containing protein